MLALRYFKMQCNNAEYKKMGQDLSLGQLYYVHNKIKDPYKALVEPIHFWWKTLKFSVQFLSPNIVN
jgi:hypothetical protein